MLANSQDKQQTPQPAYGTGGLQSQSILGSKLSIVTTAQVRYEGVLSEVDPVNKAMTLIYVKSFGSEGRRGGSNEIPGSEQEIPEARFKVDHIKDFNIIEKPNPALLDPAIISTSSQVSKDPTSTQKQSSISDQKKNEQPFEGHQRENQDNNDFSRGGAMGKPYHQKGGQQYQQRDNRSNQYNNKQQYSQQSQYPAYQQKKHVGELTENPNERLKDSVKEQFDFGTHQLKNEQEEEKKQEMQSPSKEDGENASSEKPKYSKDAGFFDAISNSTQAQNTEGERPDNRKKDVETFGFSSSQGFSYNRGGRGGRGGYRGGGNYRGGYNNNRGGSNYYQGSGRGGYQNQEGGRGGYHTQEGGRGGYHNQEGRGGYEGGRGGYHNQEGRGGYHNQEGGNSGRGGYHYQEGGSRGGYNQGGNEGGYRGRGGRGGYSNYQGDQRGGRGGYRGGRGNFGGDNEEI